MGDERWTVSLRKAADVAIARRVAMTALEALGAPVVVRTRFVTAISEITRNTLVHAQGGVLEMWTGSLDGRRSLVARCRDRGPGIPDIDQAMQDGYSTARGLGLGLGGAKRLVDRFTVTTEAGIGTTVTMEVGFR